MDCLFCKIAKKEIPSKLVHEDDRSIAFHDINPQAPTHILVIPKKHLEKIADLDAEDHSLVSHLIGAAKGIAKKMGLSDYRLVINNGRGAGQTVWHIHVHLLGGRPFSWPPG